MNKLVIPSILAAMILVAGVFAFMPIEKASTTHTAIGVLAKATRDGAAIGGSGGQIVLVACTAGTAKSGHVSGQTAAADLTVQVSQDCVNWTEIGTLATTIENVDFAGAGMRINATAATTVDATATWRAAP